MAKSTHKSHQPVWACTECGTVEAKWHGQCPGCGEWNTLIEERPPERIDPRARNAAAQAGAAFSSRAASPTGGVASARDAAPGLRAAGPASHPVSSAAFPSAGPVLLSEVRAADVKRIPTGIGEFDRVLGGGPAGFGIVPGSLVLLGGSPGIGKSTLTGDALGKLVAAGEPVLYVSGEESPEQIRLRHERLGLHALHVPVLAETDLNVVLEAIVAANPRVVVIDSVQTLYCPDLTGAPGSVGQVREVAARLMQLAKSRQIAMLIVGHVTKEGSLAGPRVLEHLVDCVLQFEGERERSYRTLRSLKNRFGSTNEVGVFEMRQGGLVEILDASARFVGEASGNAGSVVFCAMEGTRPLLVEIQALVAPSEIVPPRRVANGVDRNRLALVLAVLGRHARVGLGSHDVFVNVAGGVRVDEPAADLAMALAIVSALRGRPLRSGTAPSDDEQHLPLACFGELGLTGELRGVPHGDRRREEAAKFGLHGVLAPPDEGGDRLKSLAQAVSAAFSTQ
ncbi:MAG: DNA repair protein RadA [Actinobacteria bacterium]|nr:DNA repair protein RadA [Actinomycetota bacterium]